MADADAAAVGIKCSVDLVPVGAKDHVVGNTREVNVSVPVGLIESVGIVCWVVSGTTVVELGLPDADGDCEPAPGTLDAGGVGKTYELGGLPVAPSDNVVPELRPMEADVVLP